MHESDITEAEAKLMREALAGAPEPPEVKPPGDRALEARTQGYNALKSAEKAARRGDLAAAKQWTATAKRMADTAEQLANMPLPTPSWEEEEAIREELQRRLTRFAEASGARYRWRVRREIWEEMAAEAQRIGAPMPLPLPPCPPHWADALPEHLRQHILEQEDKD